MAQSSDADTFEEVVDLLVRLHRPKDKAYGDAWRKRGEILGIFVNIARKADRLEVARRETRKAPTEELGDTVADLAIYAGKYLTWLAETQPAAFEAVAPSPPAKECEDRRGPDGLEHVFAYLPRWEDNSSHPVPKDSTEAWDRTVSSFSALEVGLIAQADRNDSRELSWENKVELAWELADSSTWLLVRLCQSDRELFSSLRTSVARMEDGHEL